MWRKAKKKKNEEKELFLTGMGVWTLFIQLAVPIYENTSNMGKEYPLSQFYDCLTDGVWKKD